MDRERWQRLSRLLDEWLALPAAERAPWLERLQAAEPALAAQLAPMLAPLDDASAGTGTQAARTLAAFERALADALLPPAPPPAAAPAPAPGLRLGAWALVDRIGQGGMGQVWRARRADGLYTAEAAIKLLRGDLVSPGMAARFARERALLARLDHPGIARLLDAGIAQGQAFLVLELVGGEPFAAWARRAAPTVASRVRLLLQVAQAVAHAHGRLIVHRDLKPGNVLVEADGRARLLDFGIAALLDADDDEGGTELTRLTGRGLTLAYAAPEQVTGDPVGVGTDVFSLGVMLHELLSGQRPFGQRGMSRVAAEHALLHDEPPPLREALRRPPDPGDDAPGRPGDAMRALGDLEAVVAKALRKDPAQRYGSVREFSQDLERWLGHRPVSVRREHWRHNAGLWLRRHALLAAATGGVVVALAGGLAAATWQWQRAEHAARESEAVTAYLSDVLASSSPERHGGQWPTVLQLLESGLAQLDARTEGRPEVRLRLLGVMAETYVALDRFDRALPLARQWIELADRSAGPQSAPALKARLLLARAHQLLHDNEQALALVEPIVGAVERRFGARSPQLLQAYKTLAGAAMHAGRFEQAERALDAGWAIAQTAAADPALERVHYVNNLQVLRFRQGRLAESLALLKTTEPFWQSRDPAHVNTILTLRRNQIDTEIDLSRYADTERRSRELQAEMDRVLGPASELSLLQSRVLARYFAHTGRYRRAADELQAMLRVAQQHGIGGPTMFRPRADALFMRARAGEDRRRVLAEAEVLRAELQGAPQPMPATLFDGLMSLAEIGLLFDDAGFTARVMAMATPPREGSATASRWDRIEGQFARLQGRGADSRDRLARRVAFLERELEPRMMRLWSAQTDHAFTLVRLGDPAARAELDKARSRRPPDMPPNQPLDAAADWMQARLDHGRDDHPAVRRALARLVQLQGRPAERAGSIGEGSLGGAIL